MLEKLIWHFIHFFNKSEKMWQTIVSKVISKRPNTTDLLEKLILLSNLLIKGVFRVVKFLLN